VFVVILLSHCVVLLLITFCLIIKISVCSLILPLPNVRKIIQKCIIHDVLPVEKILLKVQEKNLRGKQYKAKCNEVKKRADKYLRTSASYSGVIVKNV